MFENLSESARLYLKESIPKQLISAVVKGLVPLELKELLIVIAYHYKDGDEQIKADALNTIKSFPANAIETMVGDDVPDFVLSFIYKNFNLSNSAIYSLATNKNISDEMFIELAKTDNESILELIAKNQMRILKDDRIFDALITNPHLSKVSKDQLMEFFALVASKELLKLNIKIEKKDITTMSKATGLPSSINKPTDLPSNLQGAGLPSDSRNIGLPSDMSSELLADLIDNLPTNLIMQGLPSELIEEQDEEKDIDEGVRLTLYQHIQKMTVSQKIKLALLGNKEARAILLRDSNRVVIESVIKGPRITDGEVIGITNSRSVSEDIIRMISANREWQKNYRIRQALVSNPKTPVPIAIKLLETMSKQDLKNLSNSKNISSVVSTTAKRMMGDTK
jgi:hypothetical protein